MASSAELLTSNSQVLWPDIWKLIQEAVSALGDVLTTASNWKVSVDGVAAGPVESITVDLHGASFKFKSNGADHTLTATPDTLQRAGVVFDGTKDDGAHVVASLRSQPPLKPVILVIEFVNVTVSGAQHRFRFDCPK
jgi:hypothetical protein